jgi:omega-hydroxy-beta-dihydromenaquinone-9 sulfotransferase
MRRGRGFTLSMWTGIRFRSWVRVLARHGFRVSPSRIPRALGITAASLASELLAATQAVCWGGGLRAARILHDPIVILGHWRSGTTLLHELLACDPRLVAPSTIQCAAPSHLVLSEQYAIERLGFLLPDRRPMDAMRMGFARPQEDELALCNLGLPSPWWAVAFPNDPPPDPDYETLEAVPASARRRWIAVWTGFLRAIQFEHPGRLVLKNPLHTYRIPLIREVFPAADFIHIVRDPHDLVPSCLHFWRRIAEDHGVQRPRGVDLEDRVFASILRMQRRLTATWDDVPPAHRHQIRYEDLVADPLAVLRRIYDHFGWPGREAAEPRWRAHLDAERGYRRNDLSLDERLGRRIAAELGGVLAETGYPTRCSSPATSSAKAAADV